MTAPVYDYMLLKPIDILPDRPFTDVSLSADDLHALRIMAGRLNDLVHGPEDLPAEPRPLHLELPEVDGQYLRIVLCNEDKLKAKRDLHCVGFFGQKLPNADRESIEGVDTKLLAEFPAYPAVLAYCTLRLEDGNFGNLVVLDLDDAREQWRESAYHQHAVADLAPRYYASVRLHNGKIVGGLKGDPEVILLRTKYYDYQNGFWCGLRPMA